jgi:CheY-like chemotaxis protein
VGQQGDHMTNLGDHRILVAEDDYLLSAEMAEALERAGARVAGPVASNNEALMLLGGGQIDGAVIDVGLRDGEAHDLVSALRRHSVPYVIVSGYEPDQFAHLGDKGIFFQKPAMAEFVLGRLAAQIMPTMRRRRIGRGVRPGNDGGPQEFETGRDVPSWRPVKAPRSADEPHSGRGHFRGRLMSDDKSNADDVDRGRTADEDGGDLQYLASKHKITTEQAQDLIRKHGDNRAALDEAAARLRST